MGVVLGAMAVGGTLLAGYNAKQAARREASALEAQGLMLRDEYAKEAQNRANEVRKFKAKQKLAFLSNGVQITGTPQLVLDETTREGQDEVNALTKRGNAYADLAYRKAGIMRDEGRSAFIGSIFSAFGQASSMGSKSSSPTSGLGGQGTNYSAFGGGNGTALMTSSGQMGYRHG